jgi:hypothetical protein
MINICHVNVTAITQQRDELLVRFSDNDVISMNDTNLKSGRQFTMKSYNMFRNVRKGKGGGGLLSAVNQHIKRREMLCKTVKEDEMIAI